MPVKNYLKENAGTVLRDDISYEAAFLAAKHYHSDIYKQLNNFSHPTIYAARSANRGGALGENNECLKISNIETKKYEKSEATKDAFDNFKIMGQFALGIASIGVVEVVKVSASVLKLLEPAQIIINILFYSKPKGLEGLINTMMEMRTITISSKNKMG